MANQKFNIELEFFDDEELTRDPVTPEEVHRGLIRLCEDITPGHYEIRLQPACSSSCPEVHPATV